MSRERGGGETEQVINITWAEGRREMTGMENCDTITLYLLWIIPLTNLQSVTSDAFFIIVISVGFAACSLFNHYMFC